MKTYDALADFWHDYFSPTMQTRGLDNWTITFIAQDGADLLISLADPCNEMSEEIFIRNVGPRDLATLATHYKQRFLTQLPARFGSYRPDVDSVLTEYPDWDSYYRAWLADDAGLIQGNMPVLFDYQLDDEYRARRLKGVDYAGYQRLLVIMYQYRRQSFQRVFIKQVTADDLVRIRQQIVAMYEQHQSRLIHVTA